MSALVLFHESLKAIVAAAAGTTAPPTLVTHGVAYPDTWNVKGKGRVRRCVLRFTAGAAANLTAASVWVYVEGSWVKHSDIANITFATGDLARLVFVEYPIGARIAVAYTLSASNVAIDAFPLETCEL